MLAIYTCSHVCQCSFFLRGSYNYVWLFLEEKERMKENNHNENLDSFKLVVDINLWPN